MMKFIHHPAHPHRLGDFLRENLTRDWTDFRAAVAFVKSSGVKHLAEPLATFARKSRVDVVVGIDHGGTSYEGLRDLLSAVGPSGRVAVFHNLLRYTFHPKVYVFKSSSAAEFFVGSGNLTEGGLFTNYEAGIHARLDLEAPDQAVVLKEIEDLLDQWGDPASGTVLVLNQMILEALRDAGLAPPEAIVASRRTSGPGASTSSAAADDLFAARAEQRAPAATAPAQHSDPELAVAAAGPVTGNADHLPGSRFVMTLQRTDVGVGQTSAGTSKRSPEIFVPLSARDANPEFWDWPAGFQEDPARQGKFDRRDVRVRLAGRTERVNMMTWPDKHDFRLRSAALRDAGEVGDVLKMERVAPEVGYEYYVDIIPQGSREYIKHLLYCAHVVRGRSRKRFGYF